ncbi:hypothetical protein A3K73_07305 [Candidatus Pacearchaeota archaeon RBG_13_36_9]|nr:MAG: hypothetical protein A3K73_07305 [Candidatus Pacearchaeota archaeon RBG_13_36_9]
MNILRVILAGILLWVLIFVEISIFQIGLQITGVTGSVIHYILLIPIGVFCAWFYYRGKDKTNGFLLGLVMLIVGTILDLVVTMPLFLEGDYIGFYSDPFLLVGFLVAVVVVGTYDLARKR